MVGNQDIEITIRARMEMLKRDIAQANKMLRSRLVDGDAIKVQARMQAELADETERLNSAMGRTPFAGWAMSVMFAGMALQQMSLQVARFGTKAFNDVMHSVEGTVTQTDYLNASMMYLGFNIGQALEPVIAWLVPIIDKISEWVAENPKLTAGLIAAGVAIGTLALVGGSLVLAINGIKDAWVVLKGAMTGTSLTAPVLGLVAGLALAVFWILKLKEETGGWIEFFKSVGRGILRVFAIIVSVIQGAFSEVKNFLDILWNKTLSAVEALVNGVVTAINFMIRALNKIPGVNIPLVPKLDLSSIKAETKSLGDSFSQTFEAGMGRYVGWEQSSFLAPQSQSSVVYNQNTVNITSNNTEEIMNELRRQGVGQ